MLVLMALAPLTAQAQLAPRHSFNVRGDVAMVGNALLTCATTGTGSANCANQRMSNSTGGNGNRVMEFINVDAAGLPASVPANSSAATLALPAGARVRSAGLYWGSRAGNTDVDRRTIQFRTPGGAYRSVTASAADLNTFNAQGDTDANRPYTAYADVTALVAASGSGTYYAGGLTAVAGNGGGLGNYGGWALIVLYEDSSKPFRRLMVFDGDAGYVSGGNAQSASVSGLLTPSSGPFDAFMGALVWEGDGDITGDAFQLSGNGNVLNPGAVSDALSPANNFWNSGITRLGERFTNKSPDYANQFAVDLKLVDISNNAANAASSRPRLANSATGATLTFTSTGDAYFPHALVFVTDLFVPDLVSSLDKTVRNVTHPTGPLRRGDVLEYTVSFKNSGQDGATRTTVRDPIPTHTAFVPGSLRVVSDDGRGIAGNNAPETDGAGDDVAEFDAAGNRVVFRVGAGANATGGGLLTSGQGATLRFQVKVSDTAPDTARIVNNAEVTHNGQTVEVADDYEGRASATIGPVEVPAIAAVNFCPADGGMFGIVNGAGFRRFVPGSGTDETVGDLAISLPGNLNGLMLDAARNRLLFHTRANGSGGEVWAYDANNGGWYQTGAVIAADLPRAGMTRDGVGYMVTPVTGRTARMYRLDPAGAFGYTAGAPTTLTYDVAPSDTGSGDIAFDQDGMGWLVAGSDLYRVDVNAGTATLQQRFTGAPSGAFYAGAAFGADGKLYVVVNATGAYYAMDLATGTMTLVGTSSLTSGSDRGRDLASCSFPLIAPPQLQVNKVLSTVNGQSPGTSVAPGDVLEYEIRISHIAGSQAATLFAGDVVEGVPTNTTFLPSGSDFTCAAALCSNSNAVNITAGGSATLRFRVQVATTIPGAATAIRNEVAVRGNTPVDCAATGNDCEETTPLTLTPGLTSTKALTLVNGAAPSGTVAVGDVLTYVVTATNTGNMVLPSVVVADARIVPATLTCADLAPAAACVLTGVYTVTQADLDSGVVRNTASITTPGTDGVCPVGNSAASCNPTLDTPVDPALPALTIVKTGSVPSASTVGGTMTYSFVVTNTGNVTLNAVAVVDDKLTVAPVCPVTTLAPGAATTCTGTYTLVQADLDAGRVVNRARAEGVPPATPGNPNPPRVPSTEDEEIVDLPAAPSLSIEKTAGPASGNAVGSTIAYSFLVTNTGNVTLSALTVVDSKLATAPSCPVNTLPPGASTVCTGTYTLDQADLDAGEVVNTAHAEGSPPSTPGNPGSVPVKSPEDTVRTPVAQVPALESTKQLSRNADEDGSGSVTLNDTLTYTVTASNVGNTTLKDVVVTDSKITPASITCVTLAPAARCVLEGTYRVSQADVVAGNVRNVALIATATPGLCGTGTDNPACAPSLDIPVLAWEIDAEDDRDRTPQNTPVTTPVLQNDLLDGKAADPAVVQVSEHMPPTNGSIVVNDDGTITYTPNPGFWGEDSYAYQICERGNPTNCTTARVVITIDPNRVEAIDDAGRTDPGVPLQLVVVGNDRSHGAPLDPESVLVMTPPSNGTVTCAAGICSYTPAAGFVGTDTYVYRVCDTSYPTALCAEATVTVEIEGTAALRLTKSTTSRDVKTGDLVRYSVTIENVGTVDLSGGSVLDTPPAGFTFVEGSLLASDGRSSVVVSGFNPVRFDGIDLKIGDQMTLVYLMRVGAGVQRGVQINRAQARDGTGQLASNVATAEVVLDADPLLDESLVFGTVFDDRDGDGWQDSAALTGLKVQGGFAADDYVAGSTLVDHGSGMTPVSDASAPLLRGLSLGRLSGRQSIADPADRHAVVIRQRLRKGTFTDDFVLENDQGMRVHMAADGTTRVEKRGDAAKGLTAAAPVVERRIVVEGDEMVVDYVIRNEGIDERGIPGVRLASVEGLLIETDQFGRYHLTGVDGGAWTHGRNFILKVDPSTLPAGAEFTTANPLLRRVTPGVPVRFDFGVRMPEPVRSEAHVAEVQLGEVLFAPDSAVVQPRYGAVLGEMAAQINAYNGGEVVIRGNGNPALGYQRAVAVREALMAVLPSDVARRTSISVRGDLGDAATRALTLQGADTLLGTVLFDTDKAEIKPEFEPLLAQVAAAAAKTKGRLILTGHTDVRGSHPYNTELGLRRAQAVQRAIAAYLPRGMSEAVKVEHNEDPAAPAEHGR